MADGDLDDGVPKSEASSVEDGTPSPATADFDLPYDRARYFSDVETALSLPLSALVPGRARPDGISNAWRYMREAYEGRRRRRAPVSVRPTGNGLFVVVDGNSTVSVAALAGWPDVPCRSVSATAAA